MAEADWHEVRYLYDPYCAGDQWRTQNRMVVVNIRDMTDRHLGHCLRFALTKPAHRSRMQALLNENARRFGK